MMNKLELKEDKMLEVRFVGDDDVLNHILDREGGTKLKKERPQLLVNTKKIKKPEYDLEEDGQEILKDKNYAEVLGRDVQESLKNGSVIVGGNKVYSFQNRKHPEKMAKLASELAKTPRKNVSFNSKNDPEINIPHCSKGHSTSDGVQLKNNDKSEFLSTVPHGLRKRLIVPRSHSDSESEYSTSNSEDDEGVAQEDEEDTNKVILSPKIQAQNREISTPVCKETPSKKMKRDKTSDLVEEYFEAHSSSKVLTSDRTLQKLKRAKLDQQTLRNLLSKVSPSFSAELKQLNQQYEQLFHKWMLQLHLGFNIVLYGLGSKRDLLERFRATMLQDSMHVVINGFFPGISVKSILNSITEEVLDHMGTFRNVLDQLDWIINKFKEDSSLELFLLIHNLDSQMLRGDKSQQIIGQLSSLHNIYLIASIDHLNAPLMWDHVKQSLYNWLWYETTTYSPYTEETSYENSLLVKQSGSLPLSSLTHVLRSLTPNARGIFRLLIKYQLDNQDNPSYIGLSFQDFYQQCREAFLVNSDLTLRAQLTEFRDHKLIRTKKGTDGVEYLLIPIDNGTLTEFLEKEEEES
ncbi:origin recognition complex subunit 2 isoform X1 [Molossus molossus]|uniref:Origin recognition complex subunit 2 n=1 Tax=Molossus molossus TaxID=27622 RepID=A0A7J8FSY8_MOLMO|nr:origin recognition complex subunit 2 isoform X1 [Molossus molossus]XP_036110063.1 origin recognition complex subunit 2 isoform X1 [Molossus molossus]XP_036110064.1 origin recognition complex subunit 2 isoform X1 [Molossus molossus]KAF6450818.1 origin recognition complex subunit 2 [Molossus molossus]